MWFCISSTLGLIRQSLDTPSTLFKHFQSIQYMSLACIALSILTLCRLLSSMLQYLAGESLSECILNQEHQQSASCSERSKRCVFCKYAPPSPKPYQQHESNECVASSIEPLAPFFEDTAYRPHRKCRNSLRCTATHHIQYISVHNIKAAL